MSEKIKQILVMIATSGVVFVNYLAADGIINNKTTGELAEKYTTDITPAGYAFSIWGVIYLGLIAFSIYQALPTQTDNYLLRKSDLFMLLIVLQTVHGFTPGIMKVFL
ncbi:MAG: hypothetical protein M3405_10510 [Acidobacteriota bacterium]|jgi:hypothetical protein|nr:hypothetical protein [Acidobacteriota bacterium]